MTTIEELEAKAAAARDAYQKHLDAYPISINRDWQEWVAQSSKLSAACWQAETLLVRERIQRLRAGREAK